MIADDRQLRRKRALRLERLESRELLTAVGLRPHHVAEVSLVVPAHRETIVSSLSGLGVVNATTMSTGTTSFRSSGTGIGLSTFDGGVSYSVNKRDAIKYTRGVGTLANLDGDQINVFYSGTGRESAAANFTFSVKGPVKGGAGTFAGAAGTFSARGSLNGATDAFSINLTIKLKRT
jgi:hypothetical protein